MGTCKHGNLDEEGERAWASMYILLTFCKREEEVSSCSFFGEEHTSSVFYEVLQWPIQRARAVVYILQLEREWSSFKVGE